MTTQTTNTEMLQGGPLRAALNARDMAGVASRAPVGVADGLDGDALAPARGIVTGALLGAMLWALGLAAAFAAVGR